MAPRLAAAGRDPGGAEAAAAAQRPCADSNGNGGERDVHSPAGEEVVCRYCLEEEPREELFRPCRCTNPVHTSCLRTWLTGVLLARGCGSAGLHRCAQQHPRRIWCRPRAAERSDSAEGHSLRARTLAAARAAQCKRTRDRAGGDRAARRLECELCKSTIAAKISLAPYAVLLREREGRSILAGTLLRLAYRFFLCRRVFTRCVPLHPSVCALAGACPALPFVRALSCACVTCCRDPCVQVQNSHTSVAGHLLQRQSARGWRDGLL